MAISLKTVRNVGLSVMVLFIMTIGFISITTTEKIVRHISVVLEKERPVLEKADEIRRQFLDAKDIFIAYTRGEEKEITTVVTFMDHVIKQSTDLKKLVAEEEKKLVDGFITNAKRFKVAAIIYEEEFKSDPTGSAAINMENTAIKTAKESNEALTKMTDKIRARIKIAEQNSVDLAKDVQKVTFVVVVIGIIAGLLVAIFMARALSAPLRKLITTTTLATKAADLTQVVEVKTKDEIGQLGLAYNKLIESLRGIIKQIRDASLRVTTATNQILTASQQQATGIEEEATQISQTATSAKQLAITARQVTDHGNEIAKTSSSSVQMANSGAQAVENVVGGMERIRQSILETAKKIEGLGERSQAITEIVSLIKDIADQTNLLSLNAAIEAARAGEQGKGFAVVADAIGKLAERTTKSTKNISDLIKAIQQDTSGAVLSMEESTKETEIGASLAQEAGKAIKEIVSSFEQVAQSAKEIALSSQQQSSGSEQISKAMMGIDQIMRQSAAAAKQSTDSASDLAKLAEELMKAVGQFKLGEKEQERV